MAMNQPSVAARELEDAIAVEPTPDKYLHLARCYFMEGRRDDAASQATRRGEGEGPPP